MASVDNLDLYTCEVCLENMLEKNPRLLSCHHSFCTDCLRKMKKEGTILCPTCRQKSVLKDNDIESLTVNFTLLKVKEHMEKVFSSKSLVCQLCLSQSATLKCQDCIHLLCEDCRYKHNKIKKFKNHGIYQLCKKHKEGMITHICLKCIQAACAKCVITEHSHHEDYVETYQEGIENLIKTVTEYQDKLENLITSSNKWEDEHKEKTNAVKSAAMQVEDIKQFYLLKVKEADETLQTLETSKSEGDKVEQEHILKVKGWNKGKELLQKSLDEIKQGYLDNVTATKTYAETMLVAGGDNITYILPKIDIVDPKTGKSLQVINIHKDDFCDECSQYEDDLGLVTLYNDS